MNLIKVFTNSYYKPPTCLYNGILLISIFWTAHVRPTITTTKTKSTCSFFLLTHIWKLLPSSLVASWLFIFSNSLFFFVSRSILTSFRTRTYWARSMYPPAPPHPHQLSFTSTESCPGCGMHAVREQMSPANWFVSLLQTAILRCLCHCVHLSGKNPSATSHFTGGLHSFDAFCKLFAKSVQSAEGRSLSACNLQFPAKKLAAFPPFVSSSPNRVWLCCSIVQERRTKSPLFYPLGIVGRIIN